MYFIRVQGLFITNVIKVNSAFTLGAEYVRWAVHQLPIQMGSDTCDESQLGPCLQAVQCPINRINIHCPESPKCVEGELITNSHPSDSKLPDNVKLSGKDGVTGRSLVIRVRKLNTKAEEVHCATIFMGEDRYPSFVSTISWFTAPYAGYIAFRKSSEEQSYIILNLTRVDGINEPMDSLRWEIRDPEVEGGEVLKNQVSSDTSYCTTHQKHCHQGDLTRKHEVISLTGRGVNLRMFIDENLDTSILEGREIFLLDDSSAVLKATISNLAPISVDIMFIDNTLLHLSQRDSWSHIEHNIKPSETAPNTRNWQVKVMVHLWEFYKPPRLTLTFSMWSQADYLPVFNLCFPIPYYPFLLQSNTTTARLSKLYTLYGRNSLMYHGVSIQDLSIQNKKEHCSTITYKEGMERVGYSKLVEEKKQDDQLVVVMVIQHRELFQTTTMIATMCSTHNFYLNVFADSECKGNQPINPYGVAPKDEENSSCEEDSSYLCPVGDLRNRLGLFPKTTALNPKNLERVFSVQNDVNLPVSELFGNYVGYNVYSDLQTPVINRCDKVNELPDTIVQIELESAYLNLSQKVAWQPITLTWQTDKVQIISVSFSEQRIFADEKCDEPEEDRPKVYSSICTSFKYSPCHLPKEGDRGPTLFGTDSRLYKKVTIEYKLKGTSEVKLKNTNLDLPGGIMLQAVHGDQEIFQTQIPSTDATFIQVEVLDKSYCGTELKWFIVDKEDAVNLKKGQQFTLSDYDDPRLYNVNQPCRQEICIIQGVPLSLRDL
eukprot:sb/3462308/